MLSVRKLRRPAGWILAAAIALCATAVPHPAAAASGLSDTDVTFHNGPTTLNGTVVAPTGRTARMPGLVLVAGSGPRGRDAYRPEAEAFARSGIVVLIYDKRAGYSRAGSSYADLAGDAVAGVRLLRGRPDVRPGRVGLWGHSEGGWVVPLAAAGSADVGFVVTAGASALPSDRTQLWSDRTYLAHAGVRRSLHAPIGTDLSRMLVSAGMFGDVGNDPVAALERVRQPVLGVFAQYDRSTVPGESLRLFRAALARGGNRRVTLRVIRGADHDMRVSATGFGRSSGPFAPGYVRTITGWIAGLDGGGPAYRVDPPPAQSLTSAPVAPPAWYESVPLQVTLVVLTLALFAAYGVGAFVRRARRPLPRWPARFVAIGGPVAILGTATYLFWIVMTGATEVTGSVLGRPPQWLALQLLAVAVVAAGAVVAVRWRRSGGGVRPGLLLAGWVLFVPLAGYWGLFTV